MGAMKQCLRFGFGIFVAFTLASCAKPGSKPSGSDPTPGPASSEGTPRAPNTDKSAAASGPTGPSAGGERASAASDDTFQTDLGPLQIVPIKHASLRLNVGNHVIYADPAEAKRFDGAKLGDLVLITDIHGDHFDPEALAHVVGPSTVVIAPPVVAAKYPRAKVLKNGEHTEVLGIGIEAIPMYNEKRGPAAGQLYHDKGRGNGYVLQVGKTRVYLSGDTECTPEMRALKDIDVAFVCMNLPYTMTPEEAAECVNAFRPQVVYPYHYHGTDLQAFRKAVTAPHVDVRLRDWYPGG
jgi:L-ascorbate metabolism protein UlaG (beta-lactamase superfamily)